MALFKCKMCGGTLEINTDSSIAVCEYCGTKQTVPKADDEKKLNLFNRANRLRFANEFDKAAGVYESIVTEFPEEAEAYWGLVLCKFGIEYVDDPRTLTKIPTCHRTAYDGIFKDANFELALEYADTLQTQLYREEAKEIDRLQKAILEIAAKQEPFDVFISYKESSETGARTEDSVIANDIYDALTAKGFKVFYSKITLESKLGQEYEPLIFSALSSAKVMLAIGTKYEYYNAVWVKNEWSRYLQMMKQDKGKTLIPCYKGIDAYDMPEEFAHLQAQDMGKIGAVQELVRGIERLISLDEKVSVATGLKDIIAVTLEKARVAIEKGDYENAKLSIDAVRGFETNNAMAFVYNAMIDLNVREISQLAFFKKPLEENKNFRAAVENADDELKKQLGDYNTATLYNYAVEQAGKNTASSLKMAINILERIPEHKDALSKVKEYQDNLNHTNASNKKKINTIKRAIVIVCMAVGFITLLNIYANTPTSKYKSAIKALEKGENKKAYELFIALGDYEDSVENAIKAKKQELKEEIALAGKGDTIILGQFEQDNNRNNGREDIEWIPLYTNENSVLLLSKYVLDCTKFYSKSTAILFSNNADDWMNGGFYSSFNDVEKAIIQETTIVPDLNPMYPNSKQREEYKAKVFALSAKEVLEYLPSEIDRIAVSTDYAYHRGTTKNESRWWLRTISDSSNTGARYMCVVSHKGELNYQGVNSESSYGIRPAIWIDLSI